MGTIALDPLIAEARRRARRRRLAIAAVLVAGGVASFFALRGPAASTPTPTPAPSAADELRAIRAAGARTFVGDAGLAGPGAGWAMNGLRLWYTTDGGAHWRIVTPPRLRGQDVIARVLQVRFVDARHGWVSAPDIPGGRVQRDGSTRYALTFRTTDGGRTWSHGRENCTGCGGALSFLDSSRGFSLAGSELFATRDGGITWRRVATAPFRGEIEFVSALDGWGTAWNGGLYRTTDGGRSWRLVLRGRATLPRFGVVAVQTSRAAFVVRDGVRHRLPVLRAPFAPAFAVISRLHYVAWRHDGFWQTHDGGATWQPLPSKVRPKIVWDLQFDSPSHGWAIFGIGSGAALVETTNGGRDWRPLTP